MKKIILLLLLAATPIFAQDIQNKKRAGYVIQGGIDTFAPVDATTYYIGDCPNITSALHTTNVNTQMYVPKAGTIRTIVFHILVSTNGSNEAVSHFLRVNDTTDTTLSTSETYDPGANTQKTFTYTGQSIAVAAGDKVSLKITCPTWATNPTAASATVMIYIE